MCRDEVAGSAHEVAGFQTGTSEAGATDNNLSLYVFAAVEHVPRPEDCFDPLSDITWLQFIDGLDMYVVVGDEAAFVDAVAPDCDAREPGVWLVDDSGTVHSQWSLPSERNDVLSIGRTVERTIDMWGEAK
ncbi:hypothetical protein GJR96_17900 [Haloferax sp. MBLA0076]|uniref:Uncharacterized protein n=1 Tax=Haloferax litoreum TaxID=2666140 RepID=A0A6A8GP51_9EURY|nr:MULTISPECIES: hypothetical protein [Haloferax]KAB1190045.1 hypothetical protein Hfx1148_17835 [Haloferax sp. CBA1148]MRX23820.1 hypothetical protein [Haloferax litoreum]